MNSLAPVNQSYQFPRNVQSPIARPTSASLIVLQTLIESITRLNQKVDALAIQNQRSIEHVPHLPEPVRVKPVQSREIEQTRTEQRHPQRKRHVRVNRSSLLDIFD